MFVLISLLLMPSLLQFRRLGIITRLGYICLNLFIYADMKNVSGVTQYILVTYIGR